MATPTQMPTPTTDRLGWIGPLPAVMNYLSIMKADKTETGDFKIDGEQVGTDLSGTEVTVPAGTVYYVDEKPKRLAAGLRTTSAGMAIMIY